MNKVFVIGLLLAVIGCSGPERKPKAVARVGESYLYRDDLNDLVPKGSSKEDSVAIVQGFINRWASQKLLMGASEVNLGDASKADLDKLVRQYKIDLYTKAYMEEVVRQSVDTTVTESELAAYYNANKENFKTNGTLVRLRYVHVPKDNPRYATIKQKFFDFRKSDQKFWDTYSLQFKDFAFNDSVWVDMEQVFSKLPFITPENRDEYISGGKSIQKGDSLDVYLVKIRSVLGRNQVSPYEYIKPTLKEVILNKRKLELIKSFEKDIIEDAIKDKKYEIYK
ncbi:hypothetical protein [Flavobacterium selenitireducens]|uniref:hypothetical protein n=1 Tax=Flavobacterium selenitireducens TaxID=2722704 RepID=UPI00168B88EB|nr:hypothetical protein [Flavobacterium selenitireducens]MBD3582708.1 hypothetical protein [Flavobacterium selenitireducens]